MRILVVDDDRMIRFLLGASLRRSGHEVEEVETFSDVSGEFPDVVVADMSIVGTCEREKFPDAHWVFISGLPREAARRVVREDDAYLTKPFEIEELTTFLDRLIQPQP